jgi:hypothetical protein
MFSQSNKKLVRVFSSFHSFHFEVCGGKTQTEGHRLRHRVWNRQLEINEATHPIAFFIR